MIAKPKGRLAAVLVLTLAAAGCGIGSDGSDASAASARIATPARFQSQFLASSPDTSEPQSVDDLDLSGLPSDENQFDSILGN
ncbi:MAG: hypothetical protein HY816_17065 [Candidatus Wallbacteria bacterium]|nr:hypothetical protein [Candidatus Wallbacteria bacterium]